MQLASFIYYQRKLKSASFNFVHFSDVKKTKEKCNAGPVWKLSQCKFGSILVKFLWASEVGKSKLGKFKEIQFQSFRVYAMQIKIMFEVFLILTILLKGFMQKSFSCFSCFFYIPVTKLSKWPHFYVLRSSIKSGSEIMTLRVLHLTLGSSGETLL